MENKSNLSLKLSSDFQKLREQGKFIHANEWLALSYMENCRNHSRFGWTISKKVGKAVTRNRLRRWGREFVRRCGEHGADINFVFKARGKDFYEELSHDDFDRAFKKAFKKMRLRS